MNKIFIALLLLFTQYFCAAQTDRTFWFAAPDIDVANYPQNGPYDRPIYLRLTSLAASANVTISIPANASFTPISIVVSANATSTVDLTQWIDLIENFDANTVKNKGLLIQSSADITAYYEINSITCACNPELFSLKGKNAIGNEFFIPSQLQWAIDTIRFPSAKAAFDIVATEDNTIITITPAKALIGRPANIPFAITLNKGQSFSCQALYRSGNSLLNGSKVVSDKPIAITTKEDLLFSDGPCADLAGDQLVPTSILGNEFAVVRGNLSVRDKAVVTGTQNNTKIYLDGSGAAAATINSGQSYEIDLNSQPSVYIKTDKAVNVLHYTGQGCEVGSAIIPKLNCTGSSSVSIVRSNAGDAVVLIVTKNGNQGNFLVNGSAGVINASDFFPLTGTAGNYVFCKKSIPGAMPLNVATTFKNTTGKFQLGFINALPGGCMYGYFSDFKKSNVSSSQAEICKLDSVQLNAFGGITYQWSPPTGLSNINISNPKASPAITTDYKVSITDTDGCVDSAFVKVVVNNCSASTSIINDYTPILGLDPCKNIITVGDATAYNIGDTVLLIQMKGAIIDSTNTAAFGTVTDYKSAGNYEYNYVKNKTGNQIELKNKILRTYEIPNGKVQLIRVPYYQNYSTTNTLTCLPWNGTIGGVLVFNVNNTLTLNNDIDVSGKGFRGGREENFNSPSFNCNKNDYYYPLGNIFGAAKGEGIADISIGKQSGRGKLANGGGGGNDHNSGGGGGSNISSGGIGGKEYNLCTGGASANGGAAGENLNYNNAGNKVFLGGGGGAGHANDPAVNNFTAGGGSGGGIIIIKSANFKSNGFNIINNGKNATECISGGNCNDGAGGGGSGGSLLLDINTYIDNTSIISNGGKGANTDALPTFITGPGAGGAGGMLWLKQASTLANIQASFTGGFNGVNLSQSNNPWGATPGQPGQTLFNLILPITTIPFKPNIDSVRIKDSITSCSSFDFKGLGYINTNPVTSWRWFFGDGGTANTQNTAHSYTTTGTFTVKLIITDNNGCTDSITKPVTTNGTTFDFSYKQDVCNPLSIQFFATGVSLATPHWSFGDGSTGNTVNPIHTYTAPGNYLVRFTITNPCNDTISKTIAVNVTPADIIITPDTTICFGATKQLRAQSSANFCWSPTTYLNNPLINNPVTSTPTGITYYYTAEVLGSNLITNGNFNQGNTGFTSDYKYVTSNTTEGEYFVGTNPIAWNSNSGPCTDHTTGFGNMLMINGSPVPDAKVWSQTINVVPNTNYTFSLWIQSFSPFNPAQLRFSINGLQMGTDFFSTNIVCDWKRHSINWNSGSNTTAAISIVNRNTVAFGNDFTLDDISFAPVSIKRDSVKITIDTPVVKTIAPITVCSGIPVQITTTGASLYSWAPPAGLSNPNINNPVAITNLTTKYIVTGTTINGCVAKDSVTITILPKPSITKMPDTAICKNTSVQLFAAGGNSYVWSPAATLSNPNIYNPVATPVAPATTYYVTVINTAVNACSNKDSVKVAVKPDPVFTISPAASVCTGATKQLNASGGDVYLWNPVNLVSNPAIPNPLATAAASTNYSVTITESKCNISKTLFTTLTVNKLPKVSVAKSNDINCSVFSSQLSATGASKYTWTPSTGLNNTSVNNPVASPRNTIQYVVQGTDAFGCSNQDSINVLVNKLNESGYYMPNTFTPNGDNKNDCFGIKLWGLIDELQFFIYNRYGEKVFYTNNPNQCWDGTFKGQPADQGNYVYYIKAKTLCGNAEKKGSVILLR
jgi:gliding motility-associated-like protein